MAENKENGSKTLFDMFHSGLKDQTVGQLIEVDRLPSKEEILDITKNPFETIFIITEDNSIYAAKGDESDAKFNELKPQLDRITFWPIKNLELTRSIIDNAMRAAAKEARSKGLKDIEEIINFIGEYMGNLLGTKFIYENWEKVKDPFSS